MQRRPEGAPRRERREGGRGERISRRKMSVALKEARHMALLPYTAEHMRGMHS